MSGRRRTLLCSRLAQVTYKLRDNKCTLYSDVVGQCSNPSVSVPFQSNVPLTAFLSGSGVNSGGNGDSRYPLNSWILRPMINLDPKEVLLHSIKQLTLAGVATIYFNCKNIHFVIEYGVATPSGTLSLTPYDGDLCRWCVYLNYYIDSRSKA